AVRARLTDGPSVRSPVAPRRLRARGSPDARNAAHGTRSGRCRHAAAERGLAFDPPLRSARGRTAISDAGVPLVFRGERPGRTWRRRRSGSGGSGSARQGHRRGPGRGRVGPLSAVSQAGQGIAVMMDHTTGALHASVLEWLLVLLAAIVLVWALGLAVRYTVHPGETEATHIKRRILRDDIEEPKRASPR